MPAGSKSKPGMLTQEVARIVRGHLARQGATKKELSLLMGVSDSQVSRMLAGKKHIDIDQLDIMSAALGLVITDVVREAEEATTARELPWGELKFDNRKVGVEGLTKEARTERMTQRLIARTRQQAEEARESAQSDDDDEQQSL